MGAGGKMLPKPSKSENKKKNPPEELDFHGVTGLSVSSCSLFLFKMKELQLSLTWLKRDLLGGRL